MSLPKDFCIVAGGQTGADRAALDFAIRHGIPHSGWCPLGRLAEDGPIAQTYQLEETSSRGYPQRTKRNVRDSDATLILTIAAKLSGGSALTMQVARRLGKPCMHLCRDKMVATSEDGKQILVFIEQHRVQRLNVAGPRASQEPEIAEYVDALLTVALAR